MNDIFLRRGIDPTQAGALWVGPHSQSGKGLEKIPCMPRKIVAHVLCAIEN
jgi:hypothetical protein